MKCFSQIYMHLVWGTKNRSHILRGEGEKVVHEAIRSAIREFDMVPVCVNSAWNHTHSLVSWSLAVPVDGAVEHLKQSAVEAWDALREKDSPSLPELEWQEGFAAFSVSYGSVERIKDYILKQKDRHRKNDTLPHFEKWCTL